MAELRGLGAINDELRQSGVTLVAVSVDPPAQSAKVVQRLHLPFPILADEDRMVIGLLGLVHAGGGPGGSDIAIPAHVLVGRDRAILHRYVSTSIQDRLSNGAVLQSVRDALAAGT